MMLETLFAHQQQEQAFLSLMVCGLVLGAMLHLSVALHRHHPVLGGVWDGLTALCCAAMLFGVMLRYHQGLRAYGALGILLGILLYLAGLSQPIAALSRLLQKYKDSHPPKAGKCPVDDESNLHMDEER